MVLLLPVLTAMYNDIKPYIYYLDAEELLGQCILHKASQQRATIDCFDLK